MNIKSIAKKACLGASTALLALGMQSAMAVPVSLYMSDGSTTFTCADGDACDTNPNTGAVVYSGTFGDWSLVVNAFVTAPALGTADHATAHMTASGSSTAAGTLTLLASATDYTGLLAGSTAPMGGHVGGSAGAGASVDTGVYLNDSNALFATDSLLGAAVGSVGPFSYSFGSVVSPVTAPFSITSLAVFNHTQAAASSVDITIPEPSVIALIGVGLLAVGLVGFSRRRETESEAVAA